MDIETHDTLLLLNEAINLGRRDGMAGQHLGAMCNARDEINRLSAAINAPTPKDAQVLAGCIIGPFMFSVQRALDEGWSRPDDGLITNFGFVKDPHGFGLVTGKVMWIVGWIGRE